MYVLVISVVRAFDYLNELLDVFWHTCIYEMKYVYIQEENRWLLYEARNGSVACHSINHVTLPLYCGDILSRYPTIQCCVFDG